MPLLPSRLRVEGHAIVSADGMIADAAGEMPDPLRSDADWTLFQRALDEAAVVVVGRLGHERHENPGRRRLVPTSRVAGLEPDPADPQSHFWNPAGLSIADVLGRLGVTSGTIAVTGGTRVFDLFLAHYTAFELSEVNGYVMPAGLPAFSSGHPRAVLAAAGLAPAAVEIIDAARMITRTRWARTTVPGSLDSVSANS